VYLVADIDIADADTPWAANSARLSAATWQLDGASPCLPSLSWSGHFRTAFFRVSNTPTSGLRLELGQVRSPTDSATVAMAPRPIARAIRAPLTLVGFPSL
jgi:hypothetical protein